MQKNTSLLIRNKALIDASYNLSLVEKRLVLLALVEAREKGHIINANKPLVVHANSYINHFNVHRNTAYQALKDACRKLFERKFSYKEEYNQEIVIVISRWVSEVSYVDNTANVELILSPAVIPLITKLESLFTGYELEQISPLSSIYAVRLYYLLSEWRSTGETPLLELDALRYKLGIEEHEYERMHHFKARILDTAIRQINKHTDITVNYEQHKQGRNISGFTFTFKFKNH